MNKQIKIDLKNFKKKDKATGIEKKKIPLTFNCLKGRITIIKN